MEPDTLDHRRPATFSGAHSVTHSLSYRRDIGFVDVNGVVSCNLGKSASTGHNRNHAAGHGLNDSQTEALVGRSLDVYGSARVEVPQLSVGDMIANLDIGGGYASEVMGRTVHPATREHEPSIRDQSSRAYID